MQRISFHRQVPLVLKSKGEPVFYRFSVGVAGAVDPQSGMILNLATLDRALEKLKQLVPSDLEGPVFLLRASAQLELLLAAEKVNITQLKLQGPQGDELIFQDSEYIKIKKMPFADGDRYLIARAKFKEGQKIPSALDIEDPLLGSHLIFEENSY